MLCWQHGTGNDDLYSIVFMVFCTLNWMERRRGYFGPYGTDQLNCVALCLLLLGIYRRGWGLGTMTIPRPTRRGTITSCSSTLWLHGTFPSIREVFLFQTKNSATDRFKVLKRPEFVPNWDISKFGGLPKVGLGVPLSPVNGPQLGSFSVRQKLSKIVNSESSDRQKLHRLLQNFIWRLKTPAVAHLFASHYRTQANPKRRFLFLRVCGRLPHNLSPDFKVHTLRKLSNSVEIAIFQSRLTRARGEEGLYEGK